MENQSDKWNLQDDNYTWVHSSKPIKVIRFHNVDTPKIKCFYVKIHDGNSYLSDYILHIGTTIDSFSAAEDMYDKHVNIMDKNLEESKND